MADLQNGSAGAKGRVRLLDFLRGFSVISMVAFHGMYDLVAIFGVNAPWFWRTPGYIWQQSICWTFILVSGASLWYGRQPVRRGLVVLGCGLAVTVVTLLFMPSERILFGILHCLGVCMLLCGALRPRLQRVPPVLGLVVSAALFVFLRGVPSGFVGLLDKAYIYLPYELYTTNWLFPLGFPNAYFTSSDYFSVIPWLFLYLAGFYLWGLVKDKMPRSTAKATPLEWIGRKSLWIYVAHQPVLYGFFLLLDYLEIL